MSLIEELMDRVWSFAKSFLKMLALGGGILVALSLIWYIIPNELKGYISFFLLCGCVMALASGLKAVRDATRS